MARKDAIGRAGGVVCFRCDAAFDANRSQCPDCGAWNIEGGQEDVAAEDDTVALSNAQGDTHARLKTGPWDVCFGGGIPAPSVTLIGGKPGAGKSTLSLQLASAFVAFSGLKSQALYLSTEEAAQNIQMRAARLRLARSTFDHIRLLKDFNALSQTFRQRITKHSARLLILDSLAGLSGDDHREAIKLCHQLTECAVEFNMPIIIIDHATKDDDFAGLLALQHFVDITMTLVKCEVARTPEGKEYVTPNEDGDHSALTTRKSRFGPTPTTVLFQMTETGLVCIPENT